MTSPVTRAAALGAQWSVQLRDATTGEVLEFTDPALLLSTASVGKLFVLHELSEQITAGRVDPHELLTRSPTRAVSDSGLWQHLVHHELPVADVAALVGATSDNWATNTLIDLLGFEAIRERAAQSARHGSTLHDHVRDARTAAHPPRLSSGCAADFTHLLASWWRERKEPTAARVLGWIALNTDLSQAAAATHLDPLAHADSDLGLRLWNKTGTDAGVRADVGIIAGPARTIAYAAIVNYPPASDDDPHVRAEALAAMRTIGARAVAYARG